MIYEYALDPNAICEWRDFRHVAMGFGFSKGRIFARYPQNWCRRAHDRAARLKQDDNEKKRMTTWLMDIAPKAMVDSRKGRSYSPDQTWLENALAAHLDRPFHAIISNRTSTDNPPVLNIEDIDETKSLWSIPRQRVIRRSPDDIGKLVGPLLAQAKEIRIADPYFMADPDEVNMLLACVSCFEEMPTTPVKIFQLHVDGDKVQPSTAELIRNRLSLRWPRGLPAVSIVRWKGKSRHNRYILADCGGFMLGDSLRDDGSRPDQITLLEEATWRYWWDHYDVGAHRYQLAN